MFLRYSSKEFLIRFQKEGQLYCNSIQYFAKLSEEYGIGDKYENVFKQDYFEGGILKIQPLDKPNSKLFELRPNNLTHKEIEIERFVNIFCLYALDTQSKKAGDSLTLPRNFGNSYSHFILIRNREYFLIELNKL